MAATATVTRRAHPPLMAAPPAACSPEAIEVRTVRRPSEAGIEVLVTYARAPTTRGAVVLTHGAGSPSSSIWDLPGDYSMLRKLACEGFDAYGVDVRGFGGSSMPPKGPDESPAPVRAADVQADVAAAVAFARETSKVDRVDLVAWSWGCVVAGMYASTRPDEVRRLVLYAPVWDRKWPKRHATNNEWRPVKRALFFEYHDPAREDRAVLEAHVEALFRYAGPDGLRLSNGPYMDIYGPKGPVWDPRGVRAPTLVLRGSADRASQEAPAYRLFERLEQARARRYVVLGGAGHFAFRTKRYGEFWSSVRDWLKSDDI